MAHSDFWLGKNWMALFPKRDTPEYFHRMGKLRRSIADFVRIITRKDIPVEFATMDKSYSDGKSVTIAGVHEPAAVDVTVGLALHEASHVLLSEQLFAVYRRLSPVAENPFTGAEVGMPEYDTLGSAKLNGHAFLAFILNVLEDRRIDSWIYQRIGGYRPYYTALYDHYFNTPEVKKMIDAPENRLESKDNYDLHICNIVSKHFDRTALKHLPAIEKLIDLPNVRRFDDFTVMLKTAIEIVMLVYENTWGTSYSPKQTEQRKMVMGMPSSSSKQPMTKDDVTKIDAAETMKVTTTSQVLSMDNHEFRHKVTVMDNVTPANISMIPYYVSSPYYESYITDGLSRGNVLARRLQVMGDEYPLLTNRQPDGRLDKRRVAALGHNETAVFTRTHIIRSKPVHVHLTIDASSSMEGAGFGNAIGFAAMLARAAERNNMFSLEVSLRSYVHNSVMVVIVYNSKVDTSRKFLTVLNHLHPAGCTPEGLAYPVLHDRVIRQPDDTISYFINLSDGFPGCAGYGGESALMHTAKMVRELARDGVHVLSYFMSSDVVTDFVKDQFRRMYGSKSEFISPESVSEIARTLNKLFIVKE